MGRRILRAMPDAAATWSPATDLVARLAGTRFHDVRRFAGVDSTNRYLLADAALPDGVPIDGVVAVADEQTAGRGRHGRTWTAAPGAALLVSVLLRPALPPERLHLVTLAAGVAATDAVPRSAGFDARREVAERSGGRRPQARRDPGRGRRRGGGRGRHGPQPARPTPIRRSSPTSRPPATVTGRTGSAATTLLCAWLTAFDARLDAIDTIVDVAAARSATLGRRGARGACRRAATPAVADRD